MERKIIHISSCREIVTERFSLMLRELGRRMQRPVWGKAFSTEEEVESLLYLDSGGRGNLNMMAKSMGADVIEYIFTDKSTGESFLLLTEMLKSEYKDGEFCYISSKESGSAFGNRVKTIYTLYGIRKFFSVNPSAVERSPVYSAIRSEVKKNIENICLNEGDLAELLSSEDVPPVVICDAFSGNGAFAFLKSCFGNPLAIHLMNKNNHIYAPYTSLEKEIFIETEGFTKEALFAICRWLYDLGEEKCGNVLKASFDSLRGGEELIERVCTNFMKSAARKRK